MVIRKLYKCDICEKEIDKHNSKMYIVKQKELENDFVTSYVQETYRKRIHICNDCWEEMCSAIVKNLTK